MTSRERVQAAVAFEPPDALPVHESPWEQTLARWREEGLREDDPADVFGWDIEMMYIDPSPRFPMKVLERKDGMITYEDRFGYTCCKEDGISSTMHFVSHLNTGPEAWANMKSRFCLDPEAPARIDDRSYFGHFDPYPSWEEARAKYDRMRAHGRYILFMVYGPWEAMWRHRGMTDLLLDVALQPDWVIEMAETYQGLVIDVLRRCIDLGIQPDGVFAADDLGSTHGPLMSPAMWGELFKPQLERMGAFLREHGIAYWMHSDGAIMSLLDDLVDVGVQVLNPLEVKAGMDAPAIRERYGKRLAMYGNLAATTLAGPETALTTSLERLVPLAREGGYILHTDHSCPPDVSLERYRWMLQKAQSIFAEGEKT